MVTGASILWRRLDRPGHDACRLLSRESGWHLVGTAVFAHERQPCRLDYSVVCDGGWRTQSARVTGWVGAEAVEIALSADSGRRWRLNGRECPAVGGCIDLDLNFSPSTNLLPIRRLGLGIGPENATCTTRPAADPKTPAIPITIPITTPSGSESLLQTSSLAPGGGGRPKSSTRSRPTSTNTKQLRPSPGLADASRRILFMHLRNKNKENRDDLY
jgi:hypothetical protein